jgi:GNAT superfamily N-acetyltransferase
VDAAATLDACGLAPLMATTAMESRSLQAAARVPEDLRLTVPRDDEACAAIADVNSLAYGMDLAAGQPLLADRGFWAGHFPVVGHAGGRPVSTAAVLTVDGVRYVALVATDPGQQRRGYAEAAMRRALELSAQAHGEGLALLHATDAGRPVYERMGFRATSTLTVFMDKTFLGGH